MDGYACVYHGANYDVAALINSGHRPVGFAGRRNRLTHRR